MPHRNIKSSAAPCNSHSMMEPLFAMRSRYRLSTDTFNRAIFTLPAIYILQAKYPEMSVSFVKVFMSSLLGGMEFP